MARRKKKSTYDSKLKEGFKAIKCSKCPNIVSKVDINAESVICWECTYKSLSTSSRKK